MLGETIGVCIDGGGTYAMISGGAIDSSDMWLVKHPPARRKGELTVRSLHGLQ